jgi:hypothetical protein
MSGIAAHPSISDMAANSSIVARLTVWIRQEDIDASDCS